MACVRKRRGKWVAGYRDHNGKRHWETFDTRKEAAQVVARHVTAIKDARYTPANDKRTVRDAFESWWWRLSVEGSDNRSGAPLRATTRGLYLWTWTAHAEEKWASQKLLSIGAEEVASWQQELLSSGLGPKTVLNCVQLLGSLLKHARRFKWIPTNVCEDVRKPRYKVKVRAFTAVEVAAIAETADGATALLLRTAASMGLRFGELAGLEWKQVDLDKGVIAVSRQFTHGAWSDLKTANSQRRIPIAKELPAAVEAAPAADTWGARVPGPQRAADRLPQLARAGVVAAAQEGGRKPDGSHAASLLRHGVV